MSILSVFHLYTPELPNKVLTHHDDIAATLAEQGVRPSAVPMSCASARAQPMSKYWPNVMGCWTS